MILFVCLCVFMYFCHVVLFLANTLFSSLFSVLFVAERKVLFQVTMSRNLV